jgi:hypothetical protein
MAQLRTSRTFDAIFLVLLVLFVWWAAANRVAVGDWVYFLRYEPDAKTVKAADDAGLSDVGRRLLYRTDPTFTSRSGVEAACDIERLGCIDEKGRVYILDEPGNNGQTTVTAAHEMLHLVYRRLSTEQREALAPLIDQGIAGNPDINEQLAAETSADDRRDEAHSYLGTEYAELPEALERHYAQYFTDRAKLVRAQAASQQ